jgi:chromosome segregation ATPase
MMTLDQQFNTINDKLQQLLKQCVRLQRENEKLKEELQQAHQKQNEADRQLGAYQDQVSILKITNCDMNDRDKKDFEKKVNQYIKEIDKCISFLSQ